MSEPISPVKWSYYILEDGPGETYEFKTFGLADFVGDNAAQDYWDNQGGNEASWPLKLVVLRNGEEFRRYEVFQDWDPCFCACKIEDGKDKEV